MHRLGPTSTIDLDKHHGAVSTETAAVGEIGSDVTANYREIRGYAEKIHVAKRLLV